METELNYGLMLSLKEITLRRVVIILWSQTDILSSQDSSNINYQVENNIRKLELIPVLTEQMIYLMQHIESEILNWRIFHEHYLEMPEGFDARILQLLSWTVSGAVEYQKSAEDIIDHEIFDTTKNYKLACLYCLDNRIPILWEQLPEKSKRYFYEKDILQIQDGTVLHLEFYWPYILEEEEDNLSFIFEISIGNTISYKQYAFEYSASQGNKAAAEYFFRKLTEDEIEASLFRVCQFVVMKRTRYGLKKTDFPRVKISDTFCYFLSLLSVDRQMTIFKTFPRDVLICFLDWPRQNLFLDIAKLIWDYLTTIDYVFLLEDISMRIKSDYTLAKLFQEFFLLGSNDFRKYFVNQESEFASCFQALFKIRDSETIKLIFMNIDSEAKKKLACSERVFKLYEREVKKGDWYLVGLCLEGPGL
ncbi:hypothetical protein HNY73_009111 [Argiope bruennichi]|uniref:Uncharacterized protein n=1 Tax=Argiope bruennichi TaxID=94029 RepID=A0A8T0FB83_ARGBR|nr:hypothetical protein HNY73_009111 [Argiope bruennichi]